MTETMERIIALYHEIQKSRVEIKGQKEKIQKNNEAAMNSLKALIKNWRPFYNEKAVCLSFSDNFAYYVWFTEKVQGFFRFREVPNESKTIFNFIRQEQDSTENEPWDFIVIPLELFSKINAVIPFKAADKSEFADIP